MSLFQIKHRITGNVLFERDCDSMRICVEAAVESRAYLADANLAGAYLADAYLADANLAGAYLADANLAGANLADANLADANLAGANLAGANLARANLADAYLAGAYLADANLARANLARAYLADANLAGANLARAYLVDANLAGANLADANLAGANLADATGIKGVLSVGPIGSRRDYLHALDTDAGLVIRAGCFSGSLAEFEAAVTATHGDNEHGQHYRLAIALINAKLGGAA